MTEPLTANALTAQLLIKIPERYPDIVCWRNNTGGAVPIAAVQKALGFLRRGFVKPAMDELSRVVRFGVKGQADISGWCAGGVRFEVEVKVGRDKESPEQLAFARALTSAGGVYVVVRELEQGLIDIGNATSVSRKHSLEKYYLHVNP